LANVYSAVGSYYAEMRTPEGRNGLSLLNIVAAAGLFPGVMIGVPAALLALNEVRQRGVALWVKRSLERLSPGPFAEAPLTVDADPAPLEALD